MEAGDAAYFANPSEMFAKGSGNFLLFRLSSNDDFVGDWF